MGARPWSGGSDAAILEAICPRLGLFCAHENSELDARSAYAAQREFARIADARSRIDSRPNLLNASNAKATRLRRAPRCGVFQRNHELRNARPSSWRRVHNRDLAVRLARAGVSMFPGDENGIVRQDLWPHPPTTRAPQILRWFEIDSGAIPLIALEQSKIVAIAVRSTTSIADEIRTLAAHGERGRRPAGAGEAVKEDRHCGALLWPCGICASMTPACATLFSRSAALTCAIATRRSKEIGASNHHDAGLLIILGGHRR